MCQPLTDESTRVEKYDSVTQVANELSRLIRLINHQIQSYQLLNFQLCAISLYTSNIFAILGLRSLYFLLANFMYMFSKLKYGLAFILAFIGVKMIVAPFYHIETSYSLMVVGSVLILSVVASLLFPDKD